ncbi:RICIN domain-containing protein [Streptomyces sp. NPDC048434]|uniref:RICIN domain-containing protein n=1 Tax=Streptomyces sp. NPDC048434 TaxID=3365549 RepID=UPI00371A8D6C
MHRVLSRFLLVLGLLTALLGGLTAGAATAVAETPPYRILNNATGGSLLPAGYGSDSSDGILMYAWNPGYTLGGDQWTFEEVDGAYLIRNTKTGKCLKPGGPWYGKTYVTQGACNSSYEFQWWLQQRGSDGQFKITSRSSRQVMTPYYGSALGEVVVLEPDSNVAKNWWSVDRI